MTTRAQSQLIQTTLWLLVAGAIGLYVYKDRSDRKAEEAKKETSKLLFTLDEKLDPSKEADRKKLIAQVNTLHVFNDGAPKGQKDVKATRNKDGHWEIVEPLKTTADPTEVERVIGDVLQAKRVDIAKTLGEIKAQNDKDLKTYALDQAKHKVSFTVKDKKYTLWMGKKDSFSSKYFALVEGTKDVLLVESSLFYSIDKKLFNLRRKEVFTQRTNDIQLMTVTRRQDQLAFERYKEAPLLLAGSGHDHHGHSHGHGHEHKKPAKPSPGWKLVQPVHAVADKQTVNLMLNSLKYLRATEFVSEDVKVDQKKYGLDTPDVIIELTLKKDAKSPEEKRVLHFAFKKNDAYAANPAGGPIAKVEKNSLKDLTKDAFYFREKLALHVEADRVKQLDIQRDGKSFRLLRIEGAEETWRLMNPAPQNVEKQKAKDLLGGLINLKIQRFAVEDARPADLAKHGLDKPSRVYTLYGSNSKELLDRLVVGLQDKDGFYATDKAQKKIFLLKAADLDKLPSEDWQLIPGAKKPAPASQPAAPSPTQKAPSVVVPAPRPVQPNAPTKAPQKAVVPQPAPQKPMVPPQPTLRDVPPPQPAPRAVVPPQPAPRAAVPPQPAPQLTIPTPRTTLPPSTQPAPRK